ncbi:MAG TPA: pyridoxal phosphate-dependent aminotransferase [bacterium]
MKKQSSPFARRTARMTPTMILAISAQASRDPRIVNLSVGEPDFPTPNAIKEAGVKAIREDFTHYTAASGILELRRAVAERVSRETGILRKPEEVVISCGGKHAIANAILALVDVGERVLLPLPYWLAYPEMVYLAQGEVIELPTEQANGFRIKPAQLEAALAADPKLLILNSPSNPTGAAYGKKHLNALVSILKDSDVFIISDEIYDKMLYDGAQPASLASYKEIRDRVILVNGVSKAYCMTGWRIGWAVANAEVADKIGIIQSQMTSSPSSISQKAALEALSRPDAELAPMLKAFQERRDRALAMVNEIPEVKCHPPEGAFYLFPEISAYLPSKNPRQEAPQRTMALVRYLMQHHKVAVIPGCAFGSDDHIRISFATSIDKIEEGIRRVGRGLEGFRKLSHEERGVFERD